ncbi:MAG: aldehyde dehydrogenase family protein [Mycobacterium sp.]|nr:aldehyde dehydrogenase family protein [Mycobacterium sp.]
MSGRYLPFGTMPIGSCWRPGSSDETRRDTDPWSGQTLTEIRQATADDLDEAYRLAADSQDEWAAEAPTTRAGVLRAAADVMTRRKDEIVGWLIHEAGSTAAKAELEFNLARGELWEAASMPHHVEGKIMPSDIPGKENRVYREPVGVVAVISPWNFPLQLSARSVAPALAVGNAVVLKPAGDTPVSGGLLPARVFEEAGLPPGLLSVTIGPGSGIGDAIVEHPIPKVVSFTGSTEVGTGIAQKAPLKTQGPRTRRQRPGGDTR